MFKVGINGLGRIGRAILRSNIEKKFFEIVAINDINPDNENIAYTLNYDTIYGRLTNQFETQGTSIVQNEGNPIEIFHESSISSVPWEALEVDFVIDSSGVKKNVTDARKLISEDRVRKVFVTHCPNEVDFTMVLGANEEALDVKNHNIISTSICDATAISPVLKVIDDNFGFSTASITTAHPWLSYQNLQDGPSSSWSVPGEVYHHFALGRSAIGNIIPKPTSAVEASCDVLENINPNMILSFSYRTPTAIVGSADITINLKSEVKREEVINLFETKEKEQKFSIFKNNLEPLVSLDFVKADYSCVIDHRWTDIIDHKMLKLVLWYDNEWGYSNKVLDQIKFVSES